RPLTSRTFTASFGVSSAVEDTFEAIAVEDVLEAIPASVTPSRVADAHTGTAVASSRDDGGVPCRLLERHAVEQRLPVHLVLQAGHARDRGIRPGIGGDGEDEVVAED